MVIWYKLVTCMNMQAIREIISQRLLNGESLVASFLEYARELPLD